MTSVPQIQERKAASPEIDAALAEFESRFGILFTRFVVYSEAFLNELHQTSSLESEMARVQVATNRNPELLRHFKIFSDVANAKNATAGARHRYFESLRAIYAALIQSPARFLNNARIAFVAPEREGRILAQTMGWLPLDHSFHPDAKRIPFEGGLVVGLNDLDTKQRFERVDIVDGAIASGATSMAVMECLANSSRVFDVYSVHATTEGLRAILSFGKLRGLDLTVNVGHVTTGLNRKYYAIESDSSNARLIVGDLGDTISDLPETSPA
jgi:uracil phosphoribosyltransferase